MVVSAFKSVLTVYSDSYNLHNLDRQDAHSPRNLYTLNLMSWVIGSLSNSHGFSSSATIKTRAATPKLKTE
jgi:hypothetical protein